MPQGNAVETIFEQIIMLGLLGLTGFLAGRFRFLPENSGVILSRIVIKLTAPILIVTTLSSKSFNSKILIDGFWIYLFGIIFILFAYLISMPVSKKLNLEDSTSNVYKMQSMFGNVIFLAFPLLTSLYGETGVIYAVFFGLANDTILWTLGIYLVNRHNTKRWHDNLKHLINANTIAFASGIVLIVVNLQGYVHTYPTVNKIYSLLYATFNPLGLTTIYLSMIFIGLILSGIKIQGFSEFIKRYPIFILSFFKLLVVPFIALFTLHFIGGSFGPLVKPILVLQLAMPCATIVPALAAQYHSDYKFATECVLFTTLISIGTLPLMVGLLQVL